MIQWPWCNWIITNILAALLIILSYCGRKYRPPRRHSLASISLADASKVQWIDTYLFEWLLSTWGLPQYKSATKIVGVLTEKYHITVKEKKKVKTKKKKKGLKLFLNIALTAKVILTKIYSKKKGFKKFAKHIVSWKS